MRYLIEHSLSSDFDSSPGRLFLNKNNANIEIDFKGDGGYKPGPRIKFTVNADNYDGAISRVNDVGVKILNRISLIYRCKFILSSLNYILPGNKGAISRKCYIVIDKENGKQFTKDDISSDELNNIINSDFLGVNENILAFYRRASFCGVPLHNFMSLYNVLEILAGNERLPRKCNNCGSDLKCKECGEVNSFNSSSKRLLRETWQKISEKTFVDRDSIEKILKLRPKIAHAGEFLEFDDINESIREMEFGIGEYIIQNSSLANQYFPKMLRHRGVHFKNEEFDTKYPDDEFPRDFPTEEDFKKRHPEFNL